MPLDEELNKKIVSIIKNAVQNISIVDEDKVQNNSTRTNEKLIASKSDNEEERTEKRIPRGKNMPKEKKIPPSSSYSFGQDTFPMRLHDMLESVDADGLGSIVSWLPHGRAFAIHNHKEFVSKALSRYFRQTKFSSFQRQLNIYGFSRITSSPDSGAYYHELFLRGKRSICHNIIRTKKRGSDFMKSNHIEPDFYSMPPLPEVFREDTWKPAANKFVSDRTANWKQQNEESSTYHTSRLHQNMIYEGDETQNINNLVKSPIESTNSNPTEKRSSDADGEEKGRTADSNNASSASEGFLQLAANNNPVDDNEMVRIGSESYHYLDVFIDQLLSPNAAS